MNAVGTADHGRIPELPRTAVERVEKAFQIVENDGGSFPDQEFRP